MIMRAAATLAAIVLVAAAPGSTIPRDLRDVLSRDLKFGTSDLADLERGRIVRRGLDSTAPGEVAVVGAARIGARPAAFVDRVRTIEEFKRGPDVIQIGRCLSLQRA